MSGFFSRLFGGGKQDAAAAPAAGPAIEYNGYRIRAAPFRVGSEFQTAGTIEKDFADGIKEHQFIRAEKHASAEEAANFSVTKAKQIIDGSGDRIFETK